MRIAMIGPFAMTPKATVSARALPMAQELVGRGHEVTLCLPPYDNLAEWGRIENRDGVDVRNLSFRRVTAITPLLAAQELAAQAKALDPDVVHVFKPVGYSGLAGIVLRLTSRLPIIIDTDDWEGTGGWNSINPYPWHWKRAFDWQERWLPRHAHAVTVASRTLQTQIWGMGVEPERVFYVPNCPSRSLIAQRDQVDRQDRDRVRAQLGVGIAPLAIYVGHITLGDDLDLALAALKTIRFHLPQARLAIVGTGDGLERLKTLAQGLDLGQAVIFTGWVEHERIPALLAAADVAVYPYRDSLVNRAKCSIKILEYMAMGKAIVTHRVGQNTEYLEHGKSGILAEPGSVEEFAQGMLAVLQDRNLASRLGQNAAQRIEHRFNWARRIGDIEKAYACAASNATSRG